MSVDPHDVHDEEDRPFLPDDPPPSSNVSDVQRQLRVRLIITLAIMILSVETGIALMGAPTTRIYEAITCKQYYEAHDTSKIGANGDIPEALCKNEVIQGEIAIVKGYGELFDGLIGIFTAVPYGLLADKYGRKPILRLSIPGFLTNISISCVVLWFSNTVPLRFVWLSSLGFVCGGGVVVAGALVWTMMADVTTEAQRATIFFQFGVATMASDFIATAISGWLMTYNPWIPMFLGWVFIIGGVLPVLILPETRDAFPKQTERYELPRNSDEERFKLPGSGWPSESPMTINLRKKVTSTFQQYRFLFQDRQIVLLLCTFLVYRLSRGTAWFLIQYISKRYDWTIARATFLVSLKSILTIVLFVIILPAVSWYLVDRLHVPVRQKDLHLAKISLIFLMIGTLGVGLSPDVPSLVFSLFVQTLGAGFVFVARSLVTSMVKREQTARLYTIIEVLQALGMVFAGPIIASFFKWGLEIGGFWIGLPWMIATGLFVITALAVWAVRLGPALPEQDLSDDDI